MTTYIEGVGVELGRLSTDWRKFGITVKVMSIKLRAKGVKATNEIDPALVGSAQALLQLVGTAGGACAEYLGKRYGDNIDPSEAARKAMRACSEELRLQAELAKDTPTKLARILGKEHLLGNAEQELYNRCQWLVDNGHLLTPKEVAAINSMIARLHGEQL